jgi:hypothetical protein
MTREEYIKLRNSKSIDLNELVPQIHDYMKSKDTEVTLQEVATYIQTLGLNDVVTTLDVEFEVQRLCGKDGNEIKVY